MRPEEFATSPEFLKDGIEAGDVIQGGLGDCWFLGGLAVLATRPDLLQIVLPEDYGVSGMQSGKITFRMFKFGEWQEVVIDDRIPVGQNGPLFASGKDPNEMWVALIEKAYAKLHGNYSALIGGWVNDALVDLSGGIPHTIYFDKIQDEIDSGAFWDKLVYWVASGQFLMGCAKATGGQREVDTAGLGILVGHAYSILDAREAGGHRLIQCRNPWGCSEWKGKFSDGDDAWTDELREELGQVDVDDGTFWIEYDDFVEQYGKVYQARLITEEYNQYIYKSAWSGSNAGGCCNHDSWTNNEQFIFTIEEEAEVIMSTQIRDPRQTGKNDIYFGFCVWKSDGSKVDRYKKPVLQTPIAGIRETVEEAVLAPGTYALMPFTFDPNQEAEYMVSFYSKSDIEIVSTEGVAALPPRDPAPSTAGDPGALAPTKPVVGGDDFDEDAGDGPHMGTTDIPKDDPGVVSPEVIKIANALKKQFKFAKNMDLDKINVALAKGDVAGVAKGCGCVLQ